MLCRLPWCLGNKKSACNTEDAGSIPGLGRSHGGGNGYPLPCLGNPMDRGAWEATVHGLAKSWTCLSNQTTITEGVGQVVERLDHLLHTGVRGRGGYGSTETGRAVLGGPPGRNGTASKGGTQSAALQQRACWRNLYFNLAFLPHSDLMLVHVIVRYQYRS